MRDMNTILRTQRLILRRPRSDDVAAMHAILRDPLAMRYWSTLPHTEVAETEAWVAKTIDAINAGECDDFFVEQDGLLIGKAGLWNRNEIGFLFSPAVWGKGYAREAVATRRSAPKRTRATNGACACWRAWASVRPAAPNARSISVASGATACIFPSPNQGTDPCAALRSQAARPN
jgi:hypothetical protein